jgi:hypothetical protein
MEKLAPMLMNAKTIVEFATVEYAQIFPERIVVIALLDLCLLQIVQLAWMSTNAVRIQEFVAQEIVKTLLAPSCVGVTMDSR